MKKNTHYFIYNRFPFAVLLFVGLLSSRGSCRTTKLFAQNVGLLVDTRLDPLVNPRSCSSHVHSVYGNAKFGKKVKKKMFIDSDWRTTDGKFNQTTSELIPNLSMYWAPSLYIWDENSQKFYIVPSFSRPYYRIVHTNDGDRSRVNPFPPFTRLIVGDATRKTPWKNDEIDRDNIRWTLTTFNRGSTNYFNNGDWTYLADMNETIIAGRGQVEMLAKFPDCLKVKKDGVTPVTKSGNFRSHATYSTAWNETLGSFCPETHPYQIPRLDLEVRYDLKSMRDLLGADVVNNVGNWRLSTGDASGAGGHADFISGWPTDMMANLIANCTDGKHKNNETHCILEEYELDGRERKNVPYTNPLDEEVQSVSTFPTGPCP